MIKSAVQSIRLVTIDGVEYIDVTFQDGSEIRLKGPREGMKIDERVESGRLLVDVQFEGFELV
jgi:hypothetical protein